jgi:hypothetical protein
MAFPGFCKLDDLICDRLLNVSLAVAAHHAAAFRKGL